MRRGETEDRLDVHYHLPEYRLHLQRLTQQYPNIQRLDNYADVFCGPFGTEITSSDYQEAGVPMLRISNITDEGGIDSANIVFLTNGKANALSSTQVVSGDLVISQRGTLGMPAVVPSEYPKWNISANLIAISKVAELLPEFIQLYLSSSVGGKQVERRQSGQVQGKITTEDVASVLIPKTDVQRQLVAEMQAARAARQAALTEADALLAGLDAYLLNELGLSAPQGQKRDTIGVTLKQLRGNRIDALPYLANHGGRARQEADIRELASIADVDPNTAAKPKDDNTLVPYVGLPECDLTQVREVVMRPYREVKGRSVVRQGDILFARIEPSVFNRKYVLADDLKGYEYAYTSTEFYVVRAKEEVCVQNYLYAMLHCSFVFSQVVGITTGSSGRRRVDLQLFQRLDIPLPATLQRQEAIAAEVTARREKARDLRAQAAGEWEAAKARFERQLLGEAPTQ